MKKTVLLLFTSITALNLSAQVPAWENVEITQENRQPARTTFMSYDNGESAVTFDYGKSPFYVPLTQWDFRLASGPDDRADFQTTRYSGPQTKATLPGYFAQTSKDDYSGLKYPALPAENKIGQYRTQVEIPVFWLDRDIFFRVEGLKGGLTLYVNGIRAGYTEESGTPSEFNIAPYVSDGINTIALDITQRKTGDWIENGSLNGAGIEGSAYIYSQYRIHIHDFTAETSFDSLKNTTGILDLAIEVVNNFNFPDSITVYYDLRDAQGKPVRYNTRTIVAPGLGGRDTIHFQGRLSDVKKWSPESPYLYQLVMRIKYQGRFTEYIPYKIGFRELKTANGVCTLNGKPLVIQGKQYDYNGLTPDDKTMRAELLKLKQQKINAIRCGYHPRKTRLYELCDEIGLLVCDQANIDTRLTGEDRAVGGTLANAPAWKNAYVQRVENTWRANRNLTGLILISLGKGPGIGYNIYQSYLRIKSLETLRPVVYEPAEGLWCTDPVSWQGQFR